MNSDEDDDNGSVENSSEEELDETMADAADGDGEGDVDNDVEMDDDGDADADGDADGDENGDDNADGEGENEDAENEDEQGEDDDDEPDDPDSPSAGRLRARSRSRVLANSLPNGTAANHIGDEQTQASDAVPIVSRTSPSPLPAAATGLGVAYRPSVRREAITATIYDIVPTIAAPQSTSINTVTATPDMRWVFSGGSDGYIRKFNWPDTVNGKLMLTVAQRHPFVDSVVKAGMLMSYWENEDASIITPRQNSDSLSLSPVYSLAVQHQGLWLLSGDESGLINLQSVRHNEGHRIHTLRKHTSAVSVLHLAPDERSVLSGSWDKNIHDWDLNTGQVKRTFSANGGQISAIEPRPISSLPVPEETGLATLSNGTFSSNNADKPNINGAFLNGVDELENAQNPDSDPLNGLQDAPGSPDDDMDSLFGDDDAGPLESNTLPGLGDDEDDEFSRAIANGLQQQAEDENQGDISMADTGGPVRPLDSILDAPPSAQTMDDAIPNGVPPPESQPHVNGLPHSDMPLSPSNGLSTEESNPSSETTFLSASIDGSIRVWDCRQSNPIARISTPRGVPPFCMSACWSPDGNFIYAGRRNNCVDEYSLHKGLREPQRTFKFPAGSGPVSAVRAMPNGRHLICASHDILRLYDLKDQGTSKHSVVPFLIIPGHRTGVISQLYMDPSCTFLISTAGNRGWEGSSTEVLLGYEIGTSIE